MTYRIDNKEFNHGPKLYGLSELTGNRLSLDFFQVDGDKTWSFDMDLDKDETRQIYLKLKQMFEGGAV